MFTLYRWIIVVPLIVAAVLFGIAHRQDVSFTYSPFDEPIEIPLYILGLGLFAFGLFVGILTTWVAMGALRAEKRALKKDNKKLEKELNQSLAAIESFRLQEHKETENDNDEPAQNLLRG